MSVQYEATISIWRDPLRDLEYLISVSESEHVSLRELGLCYKQQRPERLIYRWKKK